MSINWKVRANNPTFWKGIAVAIMAPILMHLGLNWEDMTTWQGLGSTLLQAVNNPVIVVAVIASVYNAIIDPTTKGISDSKQALTYDKPKE